MPGEMSRHTRNVYCQGCNAECSTLEASTLVSVKACQGKVAVCQGVKVLSPGDEFQSRFPPKPGRRTYRQGIYDYLRLYTTKLIRMFIPSTGSTYVVALGRSRRDISVDAASLGGVCALRAVEKITFKVRPILLLHGKTGVPFGAQTSQIFM